MLNSPLQLLPRLLSHAAQESPAKLLLLQLRCPLAWPCPLQDKPKNELLVHGRSAVGSKLHASH